MAEEENNINLPEAGNDADAGMSLVSNSNLQHGRCGCSAFPALLYGQ